MKAAARIVAEPDGRGGHPPDRAVRRGAAARARRPAPARCTWSAGRPDRWAATTSAIDVHVAAGARLVVRTVAASVALPGAGPVPDPRQRHRARPAGVAARAGGRGPPVRPPDQSLVELGPAAVAGLAGGGRLRPARRGARRPDGLDPGTPGRTATVQPGPRRRAPGAGLGRPGRPRRRPDRRITPARRTRWLDDGPPPARVDGDGALMPLAGPAAVVTAVAPDAHELRRTLEKLAGDPSAPHRSVEGRHRGVACGLRLQAADPIVHSLASSRLRARVRRCAISGFWATRRTRVEHLS